MSPPLLRVENLQVAFPHGSTWVAPVRGVSFEIGYGEIVGVVGESGSGKTLTALSCLRLVQAPGRVSADTLQFEGSELLGLPEATLRDLRGRKLAMIAQDSLTSLHPSIRIGTQMEHALMDHGDGTRASRRSRVHAALQKVGLPDPEKQARRYVHQLSGGMRQRAMIALALINNPSLVIADEPTTAVDATVQAQLLHLLAELRDKRQASVLLITHNLGVVSGVCDRLLVMYAGRIVESGSTAQLLSEPQHPYTRALLHAVPRLSQPGRHLRGIPGSPPTPWTQPSGCAFHPRCHYRVDKCRTAEPLLNPVGKGQAAACWVSQELGMLPPPAGALGSSGVTPLPSTAERPATDKSPVFTLAGVTKHFVIRRGWRRETVHALDRVNLEISPGEVLGIVGESGSGKSTLVRLLGLLDHPTAGRISFRDVELASLKGGKLLDFRRRVQVVFQDPYSSLDPRYVIADAIREVLRTHKICLPPEENTVITGLLERVGLPAAFASRYPHELSGGQRQRACIARALAPNPEVLIADEPVSALDVSVQAHIVELFRELKREREFTLVLVAHDLAIIQDISDRIVTIYLAQVIEDAPAAAYGKRPIHPYSLALAQATLDPDRIGWLPSVLAKGDPPSSLHPPSGCRFHTRCVNAQERCTEEEPQLAVVEDGRKAACFYPVTEEQVVRFIQKDRGASVRADTSI